MGPVRGQPPAAPGSPLAFCGLTAGTQGAGPPACSRRRPGHISGTLVFLTRGRDSNRVTPKSRVVPVGPEPPPPPQALWPPPWVAGACSGCWLHLPYQALQRTQRTLLLAEQGVGCGGSTRAHRGEPQTPGHQICQGHEHLGKWSRNGPAQGEKHEMGRRGAGVQGEARAAGLGQ